MTDEFWNFLQTLIDTSEIILDRPIGSTHPRYQGKKYPVDYGYLKGTTSSDSSEVDIWKGSQDGHRVVGILCTVDLFKRDTELKILVDCSDDEMKSIINYVNTDQMRAILITRE